MPSINAITPRQARAARAVLAMSVRELAQQSDIAESSIRRTEAGLSTLDTRVRLQDYFAAVGFEFTFLGAGKVGVVWVER